MHTYAVFTCNFPSNFISEIWSDDNWMADHLRNKLANIVKGNYVTAEDFVRWHAQLDHENEEKLLTYIERWGERFCN